MNGTGGCREDTEEESKRKRVVEMKGKPGRNVVGVELKVGDVAVGE